MVPSKIDLDIHSYLMACRTVNANVPWKIFRFPGGRAAYKEIVMSLLKANITAESLFPGLEGIARSLQFRWYEPRVNFP